MGSLSCNHHLIEILLLLAALLLHISSQSATCGSIVKSLPGFQGPLPFVLETGYVGVGETGDVQLFYYFIESQNNPRDDPLMLWLTGGPGCSGISGLAFEIGPVGFRNQEYNGSVPDLVLRPSSWTEVSSIIFVDLPAGTGFSYSRTIQQGDWITIHHAHQFLRKWLIDHQEFLTNKVYIGGDSYSGITLPGIVEEISNGNEAGVQPRINLQSLQNSCGGEYTSIDPKNLNCVRDMQSFQKCISGINFAHILEPLCEFALQKPFDEISWRKYFTYKPRAVLESHLSVPPLSCRTYAYFLCGYWANHPDVRKALGIREGSIGKWQRCENRNYKFEINGSLEYHMNLSRKGYRSLIYSGDHDMMVPFLDTQAWIRSLNYSIVDDWRPWDTNGQVAGYTRSYSNQMTFATVKGGGHTAPEYKREECFAMFSRWISNGPL
ncbi:serine carboxypeptidase-like 18 isoform X2 [Prosopis cineraria]|uniref:serine carboxypeptidase-like 18 isoform X2 n=1 Tax=Prosopis cineraria TaxID=364024 RepID=UPI00240F3360|nr:serine carboxypeptidase-like 18 isoform X2 [Prosopis cineraria]